MHLVYYCTWPLTDYIDRVCAQYVSFDVLQGYPFHWKSCHTDYIDKVRKSYHTDYIDKVHHQYVSFDALHAYLFVSMPCHTAYIDKI